MLSFCSSNDTGYATTNSVPSWPRPIPVPGGVPHPTPRVWPAGYSATTLTGSPGRPSPQTADGRRAAPLPDGWSPSAQVLRPAPLVPVPSGSGCGIRHASERAGAEPTRTGGRGTAPWTFNPTATAPCPFTVSRAPPLPFRDQGRARGGFRPVPLRSMTTPASPTPASIPTRRPRPALRRRTPTNLLGRVDSFAELAVSAPSTGFVALGSLLVSLVDCQLTLLGMAVAMAAGGTWLITRREQRQGRSTLASAPTSGQPTSSRSSAVAPSSVPGSSSPAMSSTPTRCGTSPGPTTASR